MTAKFQTAFFDIDDTLFDRHVAQQEILQRIVQEFAELFSGIPEERIVNAFAESDRLAMRDFKAGSVPEGFRDRRNKWFLGLLGLSDVYADKITTLYVEVYPTINAPVAGTRSVLEKLASCCQLGVISNGFADVQYRKLDTLGIRPLFDCVVLSDELGFRKPDPRIFWEAAALVRRELQECLHVGDSYGLDIVGAKRAGMPACWFNPAGVKPTGAEISPDYEVGALDEILLILNCL